MPTVAPTGDGQQAAAEVRDGGTIIKAGNPAADSPITRNLTLAEIADDQGQSHGSKVVTNDGTGASTTDRVGVATALGGGTLAYNAGPTNWVMRGGNVATTLNGSASDALTSAASDYDGAGAIRNDIHATSGDRLLGSMADRAFNIYAKPSTELYPGRTKGTGAGNRLNYVAPTGAGNVPSQDDAAHPTRAIPGELTYHWGSGALPTTDVYKASDSAES